MNIVMLGRGCRWHGNTYTTQITRSAPIRTYRARIFDSIGALWDNNPRAIDIPKVTIETLGILVRLFVAISCRADLRLGRTGRHSVTVGYWEGCIVEAQTVKPARLSTLDSRLSAKRLLPVSRLLGPSASVAY